MLTGDQTIFLDSPAPVPFQASAVYGQLLFAVTPISGVTPATLHVTVSGLYPGASALNEDSIKITTPGPGGTMLVVPLALASSSYSASYSAAGVVNGATFAPGPVAPGSLVSIFGDDLSVTAAQASSVPLPTGLADLNVTIGYISAPISYAGPNQINIQVPWGTGSGSQPLSIQGPHYVTGGSVAISVAASSPGIFTWGQNHAAAVNPDQSVNQPGNPASPGSAVSIYCTGQGAVNQPIATGAGRPPVCSFKRYFP